MGCFAACFPKSKTRRSLKPTTPCLVHLRDEDQEPIQFTQIIVLKKEDQLPLSLKEDEKREKLNISGRKKVRFDLNVRIYEGLPAQEDEFEGDFLVKRSNAEEEEGQEIEKKEKERRCNSDSSLSSSLFSVPLDSYRYQDCRDSDDEFDQLVSDDDDDYDEDDYVYEDDEEESFESLFSVSVDSRKHKVSSTETDHKEVNSADAKHAKNEAERMKDLESVLQPVESMAQWKAIKARGKVASQNKAKENKISAKVLGSPRVHPKNSHQEIAVDASLSTWLVGSEVASEASSGSVGNSPFSDKPSIHLRSLRSPVGSVGSYWSHTGGY